MIKYLAIDLEKVREDGACKILRLDVPSHKTAKYVSQGGPRYIKMSNALKRGLIQSREWYYRQRPEDFPSAFKHYPEKNAVLWFVYQDLVDYVEKNLERYPAY